MIAVMLTIWIVLGAIALPMHEFIRLLDGGVVRSVDLTEPSKDQLYWEALVTLRPGFRVATRRVLLFSTRAEPEYSSCWAWHGVGEPPDSARTAAVNAYQKHKLRKAQAAARLRAETRAKIAAEPEDPKVN